MSSWLSWDCLGVGSCQGNVGKVRLPGIRGSIAWHLQELKRSLELIGG